MIEHLFVYGTLRPGEVRWPHLEPLVADAGRPDTASGLLFDTGHDYPAAVFGPSGTIVGTTFSLRPETLDQALDRLDEIEGAVAGLFRRVMITTGSGTRAWAYADGEGLELTPIESGDWLNR